MNEIVFEPPEVGVVYRTRLKDVPRVVVRVEGERVFVRACGGALTWPVIDFWGAYRRESEAECRDRLRWVR